MYETKSPDRMLNDAPKAPIWAGTGAKAHTRAIAREPTAEMPINLKLRRTELRDGPDNTSDIPREYTRSLGLSKRAKASSLHVEALGSEVSPLTGYVIRRKPFVVSQPRTAESTISCCVCGRRR
jgi:hypothetical protein